MEQEYIKIQADKIFSLTEEEEQKRNLYLKDLATGQIQGPDTGIPFIDQKWNKEYTNDALTKDIPQMSMYDFLYQNNKNNLDEIALIFETKKITYKELFEKIEEYAEALISLGIKENDSVALPLPTTPEAVYLFYAINKIGACSNLIDLRKDEKEINNCLKKCNSKALFSLDIAEGKMIKCLEDTNVENVISLSALETFSKPLQFVLNPKQFIKNNLRKSEIISLNDFIKNKDKNREYVYPEYKKNRPAFIVYTSGTTGNSKAVELTSDTANTRVHQYMTNGMIYKRQDTYLNIIPLFLAFGSIVGLHLPLSMGMKDVLIPSYDMDKTLEYIKKWKPQHLSMTPASFIKLTNTPGFDKADLSMVYTWGCGGDGMSPELENIINTKLEKQGSPQKVSNGYGGSEIGAPFATQKDGVTTPGSVGIPLPGNNIIIFDPETKEILPEETIGNICMIVNNGMNLYIDNPELTNLTKVEFPNGKIGVMLGDAGYVDKNGNLFIKGRFSDALIDKNGENIWPVDLENTIFSTGLVQNCAAVPLNDEKNKIGIFAVLNNIEQEEQFKMYLYLKLIENKQENIDYEIHILDKMLYNPNGKIDRKELKKQFSAIKTK